MPSSDWDQYKAAPATGNQWDQYKQAPQAPAPTSGTLGDKVPTGAVPSGLIGAPTPEENNKSALFTGLKGMGKSLVDTAQSIHNSNYAIAPQNTPMAQSKPFANVDTSTHGDTDQMAGKVFGNIAQMAVPMDAAAGVLPSAERAGAKLGQLSGQLKGVPVSLAKTTPALERAAQLTDAGGGNMGAAGKLMYRSHAMVPMDFPEARDYYSNISGESSLAKQGMSKPLKAQLGNVRSAFHQDLAATADKGLPATEIGYHGQPMNGGKADYENAMGEYRNAKQMEGAKNFLVKKAIPGGLMAGAGKLAYDKLRGH